MDHTVSYIPILACHLLPVVLFGHIIMKKNYIRKVTFCYYQIFLECQSFITVCTRQQQSNANCIRHIYWGSLSDFVCSNLLLWFDIFWEQVFTQKHGFLICWALYYSKSKSLVALSASNLLGWSGVWSYIWGIFSRFPLSSRQFDLGKGSIEKKRFLSGIARIT